MIRVQVEYECDNCGRTTDESYSFELGSYPRVPTPPVDWAVMHVIGGGQRLYCPLHPITVED